MEEISFFYFGGGAAGILHTPNMGAKRTVKRPPWRRMAEKAQDEAKMLRHQMAEVAVAAIERDRAYQQLVAENARLRREKDDYLEKWVNADFQLALLQEGRTFQSDSHQSQ